MKRRDLLKSLFAFVPLGLSFASITAMGIGFLSPNRKTKVRRIFAVNMNDLKINESKKFQDLRGKDLLIVRTGEKEVKALSTTCTHLGCTVYWKKDKRIFYCPCHDGVFDPDGKVVSGPPPRDLDSFKVELIGDNVFIYSKDIEG